MEFSKIKTALIAIQKIKNWPLYFFDYFKLIKNKNIIFSFRNGLKVVLRAGTSDRNIINEQLISESYVPDNFKIKKGDTVVDIGAHIGTFSIFASINARRVYSFEPVFENFKILKNNIEINKIKNITPFNYGVFSSNGEQKMFLNKNACMHSIYFKSEMQTEIKTISLENILIDNKISKIDYLKMDCEGAEYEILLNCSKEIFHKIGKIVAECHDLNENWNTQNLGKFLSKNGFKVVITSEYNKMIYANKIS